MVRQSAIQGKEILIFLVTKLQSMVEIFLTLQLKAAHQIKEITMDIKIGQRVSIPDELLGLFGDVFSQIAVENSYLIVEQSGHDWIVFRDKENRPFYINFDRESYIKGFLETISYL